MAYNFKNLADVELLNAMPEEANVLVEVNGTTKRAPKEDGIGKLVEVEMLEEVPESATVLAEVNGQIKRVPGAGLGGGIKTAIIKDSWYDEALAYMKQSRITSDGPTYTCLNMTFEEAYETIENGEPLSVFGMLTNEIVRMSYGQILFGGTLMFGVPCIGILFWEVNGDGGWDSSIQLFWTADGISTEQPGGIPS